MSGISECCRRRLNVCALDGSERATPSQLSVGFGAGCSAGEGSACGPEEAPGASACYWRRMIPGCPVAGFEVMTANSGLAAFRRRGQKADIQSQVTDGRIAVARNAGR